MNKVKAVKEMRGPPWKGDKFRGVKQAAQARAEYAAALRELYRGPNKRGPRDA